MDQRRRQANLLANGGRLRDAADKLEELRGTQEGVRNAGRLDQVFLRDLGPEVAVLGQPFATDDRQGNVMTNTANRRAGWVSLALALTRCTEPGSSTKFSPTL